jgi:hypothetical protein
MLSTLKKKVKLRVYIVIYGKALERPQAWSLHGAIKKNEKSNQIVSRNYLEPGESEVFEI